MTTNQRDPFDLLLLGDPAATTETPEAAADHAAVIKSRVFDAIEVDEAIEAEEVGDAILAEPIPLQRRQKRRVRVLAGVIAALLLLAAAWVASREPSHPDNVLCYETTGLDGSISVPGSSVDSSSRGANPESCEDAWRGGELQQPGLAPGSVPPLTPCVNDDGHLAVFPTDDTQICATLGLAEYERAPSGEGSSSEGLQAELDAIFLDVACPDFDDAERRVRAVLANREGWSLERVADPTPGRDCGGYGVDFESMTVFLTPEPPAN